MKQSLVVYPSYSSSNTVSTVQPNTTTEINPIYSPFMNDHFDRKNSFHKKGIGFANDIRF
jgi:hypothetical protein